MQRTAEVVVARGGHAGGQQNKNPHAMTDRVGQRVVGARVIGRVAGGHDGILFV